MLLSIDSSDAAMPAMLEAALRRSGLALLKLATRALSRDARLLIIVDQFEELFGARRVAARPVRRRLGRGVLVQTGKTDQLTVSSSNQCRAKCGFRLVLRRAIT
jgi:hypothetical protein